MQAASIAATDRGVPLCLGDVDVDDFTPRLKAIFKGTLTDLLTPAGWGRIRTDIQRGASLAFDTSSLEDSLQPYDFISDPAVLLGFTVSLVRYPIAAAVKAPVPFAVFATSLTAISSFFDSALSTSVDAPPLSTGELVLTSIITIFNILLPVVFARLMLVGFLEERNVRLARSITEAASLTNGSVVAILGGLHVNGVAKLLESEEMLRGDRGGDTKAGTWWTDDMVESVDA